MAAYISELVFNCTAAQFATMCSTTLPAAGLAVIQAPIKFQGLIKAAPFTFTGTTNDTTTISAISSTVGFYNGMPISGTGIPTGAYVVSFTATTAVISAAATNAATETLTGTPNTGQLDFSYDGAYFVRFFGANPAPVSQQAQTGIPYNQMTPNLITILTSSLAATLGAPVAVNQAVPPNTVY
jgi:hypothetical protein